MAFARIDGDKDFAGTATGALFLPAVMTKLAGDFDHDIGAHGFLQKPFYPENVDRMLHAVHRLRMPTLNMKTVNSVPDGTGRAGIADPPVQIRA